MFIELMPVERSKEVREYLQSKIGVPIAEGAVQVLGFMNSDTKELMGAFAFERYTGDRGSVHVHWAGEKGRWLVATTLRLVAIYVFDQLGCDVIFGEVPASDEYVRRLDEKIGFKLVATLPDYFPNDDLCVYSMSKQGCRWLPDDFKRELHGQKQRS